MSRPFNMDRAQLGRALPPVTMVFAVALVLSCSGRAGEGDLEEGTLTLRTIPFSPQPATLGRISAVADSQDDVAVFGNMGVTTFSGGTQVGSDASITSWRAAAVVPSLDLPETWLVGVDQLGRVHRMRNLAMLQDVSARFGIEGQAVLEVAALGASLTAFALKDKIAVVDGSAVTFYDMHARGLAGAAGRLAAFDFEDVLQVDFSGAQAPRVVRLPLPGVLGVALDVAGELQLVAATGQALYVEKGGSLVKVFDAPGGSRISGISGSGSGVWIALGSELALFRGSQLLHGPTDTVPDGARLSGSPSGDVWLLGGSHLQRLGERVPGGSEEERWRRTLLPMFQRLCRGCHLAGGSAGLDLSKYPQWVARRAALRQRLVEQRPTPMPPPGFGALTQAELLAVQKWADSGS